MNTERRTLDLMREEWAEVEAALLDAARVAKALAFLPGTALADESAHLRRFRTLVLAATQIKAEGACRHDGGPVGTARYTVR